MVSSSFPLIMTSSKDDWHFRKEEENGLYELNGTVGECATNPENFATDHADIGKRAPPLLQEPSENKIHDEIDVYTRRLKVKKDILTLRILWADTRVSLEHFSKNFHSQFFIDRCPLCTQFERPYSQNVYSFFTHLISEQHLQALETFFGEVCEDHVTFWLDFVKRCVVTHETK